MHWELIAEHHFDRDYMAAGNNNASMQMQTIMQSMMNRGQTLEEIAPAKAPNEAVDNAAKNIMDATKEMIRKADEKQERGNSNENAQLDGNHAGAFRRAAQ